MVTIEILLYYIKNLNHKAVTIYNDQNIQIGIGALGKQVYTYALEREGIQVLGTVDVSPELNRKNIGTLFGMDKRNVSV